MYIQEVDAMGNKRKLDLTGFMDPYDPAYGDDKEYEVSLLEI